MILIPLWYLQNYHEFYHGYYKYQRNASVIFYSIPCYVIMDYEKQYTSLLLANYEEILSFEIQIHVINLYILRFRGGGDLVYFVIACKKSFLVKRSVPIKPHSDIIFHWLATKSVVISLSIWSKKVYTWYKTCTYM